MKSAIAVFVVSAAMGAATVQAQTPGSQTSPQSTQQRPDARYPNPSGQDSAPNQTTVHRRRRRRRRTGHPEDPATTSTKGKAAEQTYQTGKKADDNAGCSIANGCPERRRRQRRERRFARPRARMVLGRWTGRIATTRRLPRLAAVGAASAVHSILSVEGTERVSQGNRRVRRRGRPRVQGNLRDQTRPLQSFAGQAATAALVWNVDVAALQQVVEPAYAIPAGTRRLPA